MTANDEDLRRIWHWNAEVPRAINEFCVHDLIQQAASRDPNKKAACAWDGDLTYHELEQLSDQLASMLQSKGVRPASGSMVILCFEKSKWTSIAMLGVMKAGGISAALDVAQPIERLSAIAEQTEAKVVLCSSGTKEIAAAVASTASTVEIDTELQKPTAADIKLDKSSPEQTLFVTFTSGSTGRPKGSRICHANVCTAVHYQGRKLGFSENARVLHSAPYSFDVAWSNMLHTLCAGGTLRIPSTDEMLDDLALSIDKYKATLLNITPTILRRLDRQPGSLTDVLLSGESPNPTLLSKWADKVHLKNIYGPSECTFKSTFAEIPPDATICPTNIGRAVGAVTWIAHPETQERLVPIGDVGELWLEGPLVGQGYLEESVTTSSTFVQDPSWLY